MSETIRKHPLNVAGRYYVNHDTCLDHEVCVYEAPNNFRMDRISYGAYVAKQPTTPEEEAECLAAMRVCPIEAIHDDGEKRQ
ncbi:MAG: ferredoxin [Pyrinomonadaceae bacterium]|nr:ferredoxin [Pyrinomonadaceae bacterium]